MAATRKVQLEISKMLKKINEGIEEFRDVWEQMDSTNDLAKKEKFESELKKELKRLQRYRDQLRTWITTGESKSQMPEMETAKKSIEIEMERFRQCEKASKIKAFSTEGLIQQPKKDPSEQAKEDAAAFLNKALDMLQVQADEYEAEVEMLTRAKTGKRENQRTKELQGHIATHAWHRTKLEQVLRLLENEEVTPEEVQSVKDSVFYYIEMHKDSDFMPDDALYDEFPIHKLLDKVVDEQIPAVAAALASGSASAFAVPGGPQSGTLPACRTQQLSSALSPQFFLSPFLSAAVASGEPQQTAKEAPGHNLAGKKHAAFKASSSAASSPLGRTPWSAGSAASSSTGPVSSRPSSVAATALSPKQLPLSLAALGQPKELSWRSLVKQQQGELSPDKAVDAALSLSSTGGRPELLKEEPKMEPPAVLEASTGALEAECAAHAEESKATEGSAGKVPSQQARLESFKEKLLSKGLHLTKELHQTAAELFTSSSDMKNVTSGEDWEDYAGEDDEDEAEEEEGEGEGAEKAECTRMREQCSEAGQGRAGADLHVAWDSAAPAHLLPALHAALGHSGHQAGTSPVRGEKLEGDGEEEEDDNEEEESPLARDTAWQLQESLRQVQLSALPSSSRMASVPVSPALQENAGFTRSVRELKGQAGRLLSLAGCAKAEAEAVGVGLSSLGAADRNMPSQGEKMFDRMQGEFKSHARDEQRMLQQAGRSSTGAGRTKMVVLSPGQENREVSAMPLPHVERQQHAVPQPSVSVPLVAPFPPPTTQEQTAPSAAPAPAPAPPGLTALHQQVPVPREPPLTSRLPAQTSGAIPSAPPGHWLQGAQSAQAVRPPSSAFGSAAIPCSLATHHVLPRQSAPPLPPNVPNRLHAPPPSLLRQASGPAGLAPSSMYPGVPGFLDPSSGAPHLNQQAFVSGQSLNSGQFHTPPTYWQDSRSTATAVPQAMTSFPGNLAASAPSHFEQRMLSAPSAQWFQQHGLQQPPSQLPAHRYPTGPLPAFPMAARGGPPQTWGPGAAVVQQQQQPLLAPAAEERMNRGGWDPFQGGLPPSFGALGNDLQQALQAGMRASVFEGSHDRYEAGTGPSTSNFLQQRRQRQPHLQQHQWPPSWPALPIAPQHASPLFQRLGTESLFFAFYFQPNTQLQYLAARELKRQSWRYHKQYHTWFQRNTVPRVVAKDYERGEFVYFDFHLHNHSQAQQHRQQLEQTGEVSSPPTAGWCQRIKEDFVFEYSQLEDELSPR